jgi:hypothetical protein
VSKAARRTTGSGRQAPATPPRVTPRNGLFKLGSVLGRRIPVVGQMKLGLSVFILASSLLAGCASTGSNPVADMPSWMGGLPADAPPRRGTPAYDAWQAERAKEAARPKGNDAAR